MPIIGNMTPMTEFYVCRGIPLTPDYRDTLTFGNAERQRAFYESKAKFILTSQTYQRVTSNKCRLELNAESVFDCNYLCFCNMGFDATDQYARIRAVPNGTIPETYTYHYPASWDSKTPNGVLANDTLNGISTPTSNKWWYAFILDIEYVSNACVEITYQIDVMQSYMFDYTLPPCYVERMHIAVGADQIYSTRTDENFDLGPLVTRRSCMVYLNGEGQQNTAATTFKYLVMGGISNKDGENGLPEGDVVVNPRIVGRIPTCLSVLQLESTLNAVENDIKTYIKNGKINNIVGIWAVPGIFSHQDLDEGSPIITNQDVSSIINASPTFLQQGFYMQTDQGDQYYNAINGKLMQYPYNRLIMTNFRDQQITLRFELFPLNDADAFLFKIKRALLPSPVVAMYPAKYLETPTTLAHADYNHIVSIDNFPQVPFGGSAYAEWYAQNITSGAVPTKILGNILGKGLGALIGTYVMGASGPLSPIAAGVLAGNIAALTSGLQTHAEKEKAQYSADPEFMTSQNSNLLLNNDTNCFGLFHMQIGFKAAQQIDEYFSKYGYAIRYVTDPIGYRQDQKDRRQYWNFLQIPDVTPQFAANGGVNASHLATIKQIYANGITFWHIDTNNDCSFVGNYSRKQCEKNHV